MKKAIIIGIIISFTSCTLATLIMRDILLPEEEYKGLLDQKYECYWTGSNNEIDYLLTIDSSQGIWFHGKIIINDSDTLFLKGFEKGGNHPTYYKKNLTDTMGVGYIFMWSHGIHSDTVEIKNESEVYDALPEKLILTKKKKNIIFFESKTMTKGKYMESQISQLVNFNENENNLKLVLHERLSENFMEQFFHQNAPNDWLVETYENDTLNKSQMLDYLSKFFSFEIINSTDSNYSISNDLGLPIIQEAKDENGEWKPIEYSLLNGGHSTIELPKKSKIEIAAPRYRGNYETDLRLKIAIQKYGILTSETYKGRINYEQFKKPKSKDLRNKIYFLD